MPTTRHTANPTAQHPAGSGSDPGDPRTTSSLLRGVRQLPHLCLDQPRSPAADPAGVRHGVALPDQVHRLLQTPPGPGRSHEADSYRTVRSAHSNRVTQAPTRSSHAEPFNKDFPKGTRAHCNSLVGSCTGSTDVSDTQLIDKTCRFLYSAPQLYKR